MLFELPTTIESYKMTFVLYFFLIRNSFRIFIFLFVQNMSLCAQHSSRPFAERSLHKLLSPLFYSFFFWYYFRNAQPIILISSRSCFTELQDHVRSPGGTRVRLPHYRRLLKLPRSMTECYSSFLSLSLSFFYFLFYFIFFLFFFVCLFF